MAEFTFEPTKKITFSNPTNRGMTTH